MNTKNKLLLTIFTFAFVACAKGKVNVDSLSGDHSKGSGIPKTEKPIEIPKVDTVFFTRVKIKNKGIGSTLGIGFLPENSETDTAYVLPFGGNSDRLVQKFIFPWDGGVAYIRSENNGVDSIFSLNTSSLKESRVIQGSSHMRSFATSTNSQWLAYNEVSNQVYLVHFPEKRIQKINFLDEEVVEIKFLSPNYFVVTTEFTYSSRNLKGHNSRLYDLSNGVQFVKIVETKDLSVSADGKSLAVVLANETGSELHLISLENQSDILLDSITNGKIFSPVWSGRNEIAYFVNREQGNFELKAVNPSVDSPVTLFSFVAPTPGGFEDLICLKWGKTALFYSGYQKGQAVIYSTSQGHSSTDWNTKVFARPSRDNDGFICPYLQSN